MLHARLFDLLALTVLAIVTVIAFSTFLPYAASRAIDFSHILGREHVLQTDEKIAEVEKSVAEAREKGEAAEAEAANDEQRAERAEETQKAVDSSYSDFWLESTAAKDIHVIGDAIQRAPAMPKSGHMTFRTVAGSGGVSAAPSELEGTYAWNWARTIRSDVLMQSCAMRARLLHRSRRKACLRANPRCHAYIRR